MNKQEQAAFVDAYCDNVGNAPDHIVEAFVADYENGDDVSEYSEHATSIMDALGMWHSAIRYQLERARNGKI
jgi:mannose/cellobiose epimerase-like protein (N-acyl-D-glucosamine 2-epimerase family)